jgi:murein DD-endopeptidase MepM/ murein hydrolase activator NlpD
MLVAALLLVLVGDFPCFHAPIEGTVGERFAPEGRYAGHWGMDWEAPAGSPVRAVAPGTVTFAGLVVGNRTVTVHHGGALRTSYSYLESIAVTDGQRVVAGQLVGRSGLAHGRPGLHLSLRLGDRYLDPALLLGCRAAVPVGAVRLSSVWGPAYPSGRATGHLGRDLRPTSPRPPGGR